jgi:Bacterial Ig-like domain (group 2)/Electron transfer DM13
MKQLFKIFPLFTVLLLNSCVGTDLIDDPIIAEKIRLSPRIDSLTVGQEQIFSIKFTDKYGVEESAKNSVWRSSDPSKITVDATGKAKAIALGKATIYVTNGVATDSLVLNKQSNSNPITNSNPVSNSNDTTYIKRSVFKRFDNSHDARGGVRIQTVKGITQIVTEGNFSTSAGPSLYLLLTNHLDGRYTVTPNSQAISAVSAQVTPNKLTAFSGVQTWTVSSNINPKDYKYIILYCTLGFVFGSADIQ